MLDQTVVCVELYFKFSLVVVNILSIVLTNVTGLTLNLSLLHWEISLFLLLLIEYVLNRLDIVHLFLKKDVLIILLVDNGIISIR